MLRPTLNRAILAVLFAVVVAALVPTGVVLYRRLASALEDRARADLARAPRILGMHRSSTADAMMMHAKDFAGLRALADAVQRHDTLALLKVGEQARGSFSDGLPVVVGSDGKVVIGPQPSAALLEETRIGRMPVQLSTQGRQTHNIALAPIALGGKWIGAAGFASPVDAALAGTLGGLTRADVLILVNDSVIATTLNDTASAQLNEALRSIPADSLPREISTVTGRYLTVSAPLGAGAKATFVRSVAEELSVLPELRNIALVSGALAMVIALTLGALLSNRVAAPAHDLAVAAGDIARESFDAPLPTSRIYELHELSSAFAVMRERLAERLAQLNAANTTLADRNAKLTALQSELLQRDRLQTTARLLAQLAHEIRNPVANIRNCLEIIRRRTTTDERTREFAELAIDELLRMHELAEQMLDVNRPRDPLTRTSHAVAVVRDVVRLARVGTATDTLSIDVAGDERLTAAIAPDALKQVLTNLVQNSREAVADEVPPVTSRVSISVGASAHGVRIDVRDNGPGVPADLRGRIFDAFFTTKETMNGVGLGLYVAVGLVQAAGGRITSEPVEGEGALFRVELPAATPGTGRGEEPTSDRTEQTA